MFWVCWVWGWFAASGCCCLLFTCVVCCNGLGLVLSALLVVPCLVCWWALRVFPGGNQVDGLPPAPSICGNGGLQTACVHNLSVKSSQESQATHLSYYRNLSKKLITFHVTDLENDWGIDFGEVIGFWIWLENAMKFEKKKQGNNNTTHWIDLVLSFVVL